MHRSRFIMGSLALLVVLAGALFLGPTASQAAAVCNTVHTTDLSTWNLIDTRAQGHNELVDGGLHIWTVADPNPAPPDDSKAAGYYPLSVNLSTITGCEHQPHHQFRHNPARPADRRRCRRRRRLGWHAGR